MPDTSWTKVAEWYNEHLAGDDTYHAKVVLPNVLRLVAPQAGDSILDIACGQGYFSRAFHKAGATVTGIDLGPDLIDIARKQSPAEITYEVGSAADLSRFGAEEFNKATIILALQNIQEYQAALKECARVLTPRGQLCIVLNHPAFRIPQKTSWQYDEQRHQQFRRVDEYLSESRAAINMEPGKGAKGQHTFSFHRPLQAYSKAFEKAGFAITRLEEWVSHRVSEAGPRKQAEDKSRKEIPLFMCLVVIKL